MQKIVKSNGLVFIFLFLYFGCMKRSKYIDHTLLKPESTIEDIKQLCKEAKDHDFASVCVNPYWVSYCSEELKESSVMVCTVIGFPLGATTSTIKAMECKEAIENGADEIDMVLNIGELKSGNEQLVYQDIKAVVDAANGKTVKVILETCLLSDEQIKKACLLSEKAGADFVKTSTGFNAEGANVHVVQVMKSAIGNRMKIKAAGGVRTPEEMDEMIQSGANRIGTSHGVDLI